MRRQIKKHRNSVLFYFKTQLQFSDDGRLHHERGHAILPLGLLSERQSLLP
jgi:hypothetical protein